MRKTGGLVIVAGVLLVGCAGSPTGTVSGRLLMVGGPANVVRPTEGYVAVEGTEQRTDVGPDGMFSIQVPPGEYVLVGGSPQYGGGEGGCRSQGSVTVTEGETTSADVLCEMW